MRYANRHRTNRQPCDRRRSNRTTCDAASLSGIKNITSNATAKLQIRNDPNVVEADDACEDRRDASSRYRGVSPQIFLQTSERACEQATAQCSERQASFHFRLISNGRSYMYTRSRGSAYGCVVARRARVRKYIRPRSTAVTLYAINIIVDTNREFFICIPTLTIGISVKLYIHLCRLYIIQTELMQHESFILTALLFYRNVNSSIDILLILSEIKSKKIILYFLYSFFFLSDRIKHYYFMIIDDTKTAVFLR